MAAVSLLEGIALAAAILTFISIGILTLAPVQAPGGFGSGKIYHILAFAALAVPLSFALPRFTLGVILFALAYGGFIEIVQPFAGRERELPDLLADAAGGTLGAFLGFVARRVWDRFFVASPR